MYGSYEDANIYFTSRPNPLWTEMTEEAKRVALLSASSMIDALYEQEFIGTRTSGANQENAWPRKGPIVEALGLGPNDIPTLVENATYDLAVIWEANKDIFNRVYDPTKTVKSRTVGPITTVYAIPDHVRAELPSLPLVRGKLSPLLKKNNLTRMPVLVV